MGPGDAKGHGREFPDPPPRLTPTPVLPLQSSHLAWRYGGGGHSGMNMVSEKDPVQGADSVFGKGWWVNVLIYYPPEVSSMKHCHLGVFRKEYFRLVTK